MTDVQTNVRTYFAMFDGKQKKFNEEAMSIVQQAIYKDKFTVVTPKGEIKYDQWLDAIKHEYENGTFVTLLEMKDHPSGIEYSAILKNPDVEEQMTIRSVGIVEGGKLVRVEPTENGANYNKFLGDPN